MVSDVHLSNCVRGMMCKFEHASRHQGKPAGLREALGLYERLQAMTEDIHGARDANNALALRSIADIHSLLGQHGARMDGRNHPRHNSCLLRISWLRYHQACMQGDQLPGHAGEAVAFNERAANVAIAVHGREHPVMESYWGAVAKSKHQVRQLQLV